VPQYAANKAVIFVTYFALEIRRLSIPEHDVITEEKRKEKSKAK
jgi:hypothetical protein